MNVLKTLEAPMRTREPSYRSLEGLHADKDAITWYWRVTAVASSIMILGGYVCQSNAWESASRVTSN